MPSPCTAHGDCVRCTSPCLPPSPASLFHQENVPRLFKFALRTKQVCSCAPLTHPTWGSEVKPRTQAQKSWGHVSGTPHRGKCVHPFVTPISSVHSPLNTASFHPHQPHPECASHVLWASSSQKIICILAVHPYSQPLNQPT